MNAVLATSALFPMSALIARLQAAVPELKQVRGVAAYAGITNLRAFTPPEAFVMLARERGLASAGAGQAGGPNAMRAAQPVTVSFGVVIAVRTARDAARGGAAAEDVSPIVGQVRNAIVGWTPIVDGKPLRGGRPCTFVQGDLLDYSVDTLLWSEIYQTQHFVGSTQ